MIHQSDVGQTIEYRGDAMGVFPRGIDSVSITLVSLLGEAAFLQSQTGMLFGVLASDCSNPTARSSPHFSPNLPARMKDGLDDPAWVSELLDVAPAALAPPEADLSSRLRTLRQRAQASPSDSAPFQDTQPSTPSTPTPPQNPSDPNHFVVLPMPAEIPNWSVEKLHDRFKSLRSSRADARRNTP